MKRPKWDSEKAKDRLKRATWLTIAVVFVLTGLVVGVVGFWQATHQDDASSNQQAKLVGSPMPGFTPIADIPELQVADATAGEGAEVKASSTVTIHYIGALAATGVVFDTSLDTGQPAQFSLNGLIPGFAQGITGMKVGGTRQILIPSDLGYGAAGYPPDIPPDADLVFSVSLLDVQ